MKKMITLLLVITLLVLCSCTGTPHNGGSPQNQLENGSENPEGTMVLRFAINPEFSLCLDEAKTVLSAEAENEDAKTLLASLTFEGKPYAETVTAILDAAYTQGFLKDGSEINVSIAMPQTADSSLAFIDLPISAFEREKGIATTTVINLLTDPNAQESSVVIDGRKYVVSNQPLYDGDRADDQMVQVGTLTNIICKQRIGQDDPTAFSKKEIAQFFNGNTWVTFYHNASIMRILKTYVNGECYDCSYYPDGSVAYSYTAHANGDFDYSSYAEDGTLLESENLTDGNYDSTLRQEDGTYHSYVINADGNCSESVFIMGGPYIYTVAYFPGGNSCITYYDENGNICSQEDHVEDACIYSTYDESGNLIRVERIESDGSRTETTFNSSGEIVFWREYDANGVVISEEG